MDLYRLRVGLKALSKLCYCCKMQSDFLLRFDDTSAAHHWAAPPCRALSDVVPVAEHPQGRWDETALGDVLCSRGVQCAPSTNEHSGSTIR